MTDDSKPTSADQVVGKGCLWLVMLMVGAVVVGVGWNMVFSKDETPGGTKAGAFDVCKDFVRQELRSPATAVFRNFFQDDGEVRVFQSGDEFAVSSSVDAQNGFGAMIRSNFHCTVRWVNDDVYRKVSVEMF